MSNKQNDKQINAQCCNRCGAYLMANGLLGHIGPRRLCPRCLFRIKALLDVCTVERFVMRQEVSG